MSDSEQPRTAAEDADYGHVYIVGKEQDHCKCGKEFIGGWKGYAFHLEDVLTQVAIEAEAGAASPSEPLQRLHRAVAGLPVHMGHGAIRAIEVLELIEAEQRAALAAPSQEPCPYCRGKRWVEDENWQPDDPATWRGERSHGDGLIPCGGCNGGGWTTPDYEPEPAQERASEPAGLNRGALERACIAVAGPWFDESHERGAFRPMELAQRILREYDLLTSSASAQERPADAALQAIEALGEHPDSRYHTEQTATGGGHAWRCIPIVDAIDALAVAPAPAEQPAEKGDAAS